MLDNIFQELIDNKLDIQKTYKKFKNEYPDYNEFIKLISGKTFDNFLETKTTREYMYMKYNFFRASNEIIANLTKELKNDTLDIDNRIKLFTRVTAFINTLESQERQALSHDLKLPAFESLKLDIIK